MIRKLRDYLFGPGLGPLLIKAVGGSAGFRIAGMGFGFLVGVQLARGLGAEGYGVYGVAMSLIALLTVPTEFGLPQLLTREVAASQTQREWGRLKGVLEWSSRLSLLIAAFIGIAVILYLFVSGTGLSSALGMTLLAGVAMVPVVAQLSMASAALRGLQLLVRGQIPDVLLRPLFYSLLLFAVPLLITPLNSALAMGLGVISAGLALTAARYMLNRAMPREVRVADASTDSRRWWASALPMALTEGMRLLQGHLLILLLGWMVLMADVGIYRVASSAMLLVAMPISLLNIVGMPVIARLHASGQHATLQRMLGFIAGSMLLGVLSLSLPFLLAGDWLFASVFGEEFGAASKVMRVLCIAMLVNAFFGANAAVLNMAGYQNKVTLASLFALIALLLSAGPLIHFEGAVGAALSSLISLTIWNVAMWRFASREAKLDTSVLSLRHHWHKYGE